MNKVVIRNRTEQAFNMHLAVYPFPHLFSTSTMMSTRGDYGHDWEEPMPEWQRNLADSLWDAIPGLTRLFFKNGEITLQHAGVFDDPEILGMATKVIEPVLQSNLTLQEILDT